MAVEQRSNKQKEERKLKRSLPSFLVFLAISTALWFLIKLSENYTTQTTFKVLIENVPADRCILSEEQPVKMSLNIDGFHTLRYMMIRESKRAVAISLNDVSYHLENGNQYSFSAQYVAEKVAHRLGINASDITMNDAKVYFNMDPLKSKKVKVFLHPHSEIKADRQYEIYGSPELSPDSVTIYGSEEIVDNMDSISTMPLSKTNVSQSFVEPLALDLLGGQLNADVNEVNVNVHVEKFTEIDVEVPIQVPDSLILRLSSETINVKCHVSLKDYSSVKPEDFTAVIDAEQLKTLPSKLDVKLIKWPSCVKVIGGQHSEVNYFIVQ